MRLSVAHIFDLQGILRAVGWIQGILGSLNGCHGRAWGVYGTQATQPYEMRKIEWQRDCSTWEDTTARVNCP